MIIKIIACIIDFVCIVEKKTEQFEYTARISYSLNTTSDFSKLCDKDNFLFVLIHKNADFLPLSVSF